MKDNHLKTLFIATLTVFLVMFFIFDSIWKINKDELIHGILEREKQREIIQQNCKQNNN